MFPKESKRTTRDDPTPMKPSSIDWRVPTLMTVSLLLGVLLAIGHHLFYNSLHGTFVKSDNQQIWNLRIGTGLAFLIKVCLTTAVSIACVQHFWLLLRQRALPLSRIDAFFDVLTNGASLLDLRIWHQGPVIILLAVIVWCIPFSAIITPSTLTIVSGGISQHSQIMPIPNINWNDYSMFDTGGFGYFSNPSDLIRRQVSSVGITGSVSNIAPPVSNSSYYMTYYAPAIECSRANDTVFKEISAVYNGSINNNFYTSFVPTSRTNITEMLNNTNNLDTLSKDHARIFFIVPFTKNLTVVECGLFNASYIVLFNFSSFSQSAVIQNRTLLHEIWGDTYDAAATSKDFKITNILFNYLGIMSAFGELLVGSIGFGASGGIRRTLTSFTLTSLLGAQDVKPMWDRSSITSYSPIAQNYTLAEGLEDLFTNITLSLFSSSQFLHPMNESAPTNVTISVPRNLYVYSPRNIWVSYGLAILFAILGALLGMGALLTNSAAFTNSFSTILRVTGYADLSTIVGANDTFGAAPLPKHLKQAKLSVEELSTSDGLRYWSLAEKRT